MPSMFIFTFLGTVGFSLFGVLFSIFKTKVSNKLIKFFKGFTLGSIVALLITEIIPEPIHEFSHIVGEWALPLSLLIIGGLFGLFYIFHFIFDHSHKHHEVEDCDSHDFHLHQNKSKLISSIIFLCSISLHNIPEGIALGTSFLSNITNGIIMSILVFGLHNFVISYMISDSLLNSKLSKRNTIILTLLSSFITFIFGIVGYFIGETSELLSGILLSLSAGAMLFITMKELIPSVIKNHDDYTVISIALGLIITILFSFLFNGIH